MLNSILYLTYLQKLKATSHAAESKVRILRQPLLVRNRLPFLTHSKGSMNQEPRNTHNPWLGHSPPGIHHKEILDNDIHLKMFIGTLW